MKSNKNSFNTDDKTNIPDYTKIYDSCFIIKYRKLGSKVFEKYITVQDGSIYLLDKEDGIIIDRILIGTIK